MEEDYKKLYEAVSARFNIGTYDEFQSKMNTPEDRKGFYDSVSKNGFDLGDYNSYESRLKKKEQPTPQATNQSSVSTPSGGGLDSQNVQKPEQAP